VGQFSDGELAMSVEIEEHGFLLPEVVIFLFKELLQV